MQDALRRSVHDIGVVLDAIADGVTAQDPTGALVYANRAAATALGFDSPEDLLAAPLDRVLARFELLDEHGNAFPVDRLPGRLALEGIETRDVLVRFRVRDTGEERWSLVTARPVRDAEGRVQLAVNIFRDVTERKRVEDALAGRARRQAVVAHLGQRAVAGSDVDALIREAPELVAETLDVPLCEVLELSPEGDRLVLRAGVGWPEDLLGSASVGIGPGSQGGFVLASPDPVTIDFATERRFEPSPLAAGCGATSGVAVAMTGRPRAFGVLAAYDRRARRFTDDEGHFLQAVANVIATGAERARIEAERTTLLERERRSRAEAEAAQWGLAFLAVASNVLASSLDYETTLANVARLAVPTFADWCVVHLLQGDRTLREVALTHADPEKVALVRELQERYPQDQSGERGAGKVSRTGKAELYPEIPDELLAAAARDEEHLERLRALGMRSAMVVPLSARGRTLGALTFVSAESGRRYGEADLSLAEDLARRAAIAVDNARLYETSTRVARTLQQSLLPPELPDIPGLDVAARFRPAGRGDEVGGDFYDLFETGGGNWAILIGDVCGKGADAAALTGLSRHTLRAAAMRETRPSAMLRTLNEALLRQAGDQRFCTVACLRVRPGPERARVTVACGGHPLPIVLRADGSLHRVGRPGSLLGVFPDAELLDDAVDLDPGDVVVLYTDGVVEERAGAAVFGEDRLARVVAASAGRDAATMAEQLERAVVDFQPGLPRDDMALLVIRVVSGIDH